jgi:Domain of unknown function (DUF5710)
MRQPPKSTAPDRIYLDVPYRDKDTAKALGARWDPAAKRWYGPRPPTSGLARWVARPDVPELLPGGTEPSAMGCSWTWCPPRVGSPTSAAASRSNTGNGSAG